MQVFENLIQGSPEWFQARAGIVTASVMQQLLARGQGKTRAALMHKLIAERMTGEVEESYTNAHMERGKELEGTARELYLQTVDVTGREVGFVRNHEDIGGVGYSPDYMLADGGIVEIKTRLGRLQVELLLDGRVPSEHTAQIQCGLWVAEAEYLDFVSYSPFMPLFKARVYRDEAYIQNMREEVIAFYAEMKSKIQRIRGL